MRTILATWLVLALLIAAAIVIVSIIVYNKRLDRIARGEVRGTHSPIPEPKTTVAVLYRTVVMGIMIVMLFSISALNGKLDALRSDIFNLQNRVNMEKDELYRMLEDSQKRVSSFSWECHTPDFEEKTAVVDLSVVLKEYTEDTAVSVDLNGNTIPLTRKANGTYIGQFVTGLFDDYDEARIYVTENGKTMLEQCDFPSQFFWDFVPMPNIACNMTAENRFGRLKYEGSYAVFAERPEEIEAVSVTYIADGKEIKSADITEQVHTREEIPLEKGMNIKKSLVLRIEIITSHDLKITEQSVMITEDNEDFEKEEFTSVSDLNGNILWNSDSYK